MWLEDPRPQLTPWCGRRLVVQEEMKGKIRVYCRVRPLSAKEGAVAAVELTGKYACQISLKGL